MPTFFFVLNPGALAANRFCVFSASTFFFTPAAFSRDRSKACCLARVFLLFFFDMTDRCTEYNKVESLRVILTPCLIRDDLKILI